MATAFEQGRASMAIALPRRNTEQLCFIFSPITSVFSLRFRSVGYGKPSLSCKLIIYLHYITLHYIKSFFLLTWHCNHLFGCIVTNVNNSLTHTSWSIFSAPLIALSYMGHILLVPLTTVMPSQSRSKCQQSSVWVIATPGWVKIGNCPPSRLQWIIL